MLPQALDFFDALEIARIDDAHRDEDHVLEVVGHEPDGVEQRVHAQAAVAADEDHRRVLLGIGRREVRLALDFDRAQRFVEALQPLASRVR